MLGLSYTYLGFLTHILLRAFTGKAICGTNVEVTGAHILLSLSPPIPRYGHRLLLPNPYLCRTPRTTPV
jgi:hypothetical protein